MPSEKPVRLAFLSSFFGEYAREARNLRTATEHGAYKLLLDYYGEHGYLPTDDRTLARIAYCSPSEWADIRDVIASLFEPGWTHARLDQERDKATLKNTLIPQWQRHRPPTASERMAVLDRDGHVCAYCGASDGPIECDHKVPLSRGGSSSSSNLTASCRRCNRSKGARLTSEWEARS